MTPPPAVRWRDNHARRRDDGAAATGRPDCVRRSWLRQPGGDSTKPPIRNEQGLGDQAGDWPPTMVPRAAQRDQQEAPLHMGALHQRPAALERAGRRVQRHDDAGGKTTAARTSACPARLKVAVISEVKNSGRPAQAHQRIKASGSNEASDKAGSGDGNAYAVAATLQPGRSPGPGLWILASALRVSRKARFGLAERGSRQGAFRRRRAPAHCHAPINSTTARRPRAGGVRCHDRAEQHELAIAVHQYCVTAYRSLPPPAARAR